MFIVFWIGFCAVPAIIASNKGRSAAGWFFGSILISPLLGGIIVACLPTLTGKLEQRAMSSGEMRKCPHCAELVKAEAKICRHCQRELPVVTTETGHKPELQLHRIPERCPTCKGEIRTLTLRELYRCPMCQENLRVIDAAVDLFGRTRLSA
jgi:hypothetical protein